MLTQIKNQEYEADICLLLEGTYPYVSGGVSSWVHSLIKGMEEFTFSLFVILPDSKIPPMKYAIPDNVTKIRTMSLHDKKLLKKPFRMKTFTKSQYELITSLHLSMPFTEGNEDSDSGKDEFPEVVKAIYEKKWNPAAILYAEQSWKALLKLFFIRAPEESFTDYMWTWRFLHVGIFAVMKQTIPKCRVYHTVCTGYAGLMAANAKIINERPMILTEHGIYSKERKIEISKSSWIFDQTRERFRAEKSQSIFKTIWINAFRAMSRFCYDQAEEIITLYTGNQRLQIDDGAPLEKLKIIPNAVDFSALAALTLQPQEKKIVGFVGRVVPIKDVKTLIRAMKLVSNLIDDLEVWIMGPTEEDPDYYAECVQLVHSLELEQQVVFTGNVNLKEYYPKLDIMVLTSLSEGQPLVILEAQCLGIPVVASDVGACSELLEGRGEDKYLGRGGIITGLSAPEETAAAVAQILNTPELAKAMGEAGRERMRLFFDLPIFYRKYREIYRKYCDQKE